MFLKFPREGSYCVDRIEKLGSGSCPGSKRRIESLILPALWERFGYRGFNMILFLSLVTRFSKWSGDW